METEMREDLLERIASALEGINTELADISSHLESLDDIGASLDSCIATNGKNRFLCITGNISSY